MPILLQYMIKLSISLALVYLFYQVFLRRLTFHQWNRWYLLLYSLICFFLPLLNIYWWMEAAPERQAIIQYVPRIVLSGELSAAPAGISTEQLLLWIAFAGIICIIAKLLLQYFSYRRLKNRSQLLVAADVKLYSVTQKIIPFSFGNAVYINPDLHHPEELKDIIRHEMVHVRQRHSIDMFFAELLVAFNWYNPFAWLIRHAIRQNLEFIADKAVLKHGVDRKTYQYLLLKVIGQQQFSLGTHLNFSALKNRINMMNRLQSAKLQLLKFSFAIPLLVILLLAFRNERALAQQPAASKTGTTSTGPSSPATTGTAATDGAGVGTFTGAATNGEGSTVAGTAVDLAKAANAGLAVQATTPNLMTTGLPVGAVGQPFATGLVDTLPYGIVNKKGYILSVANNDGECIVIIKDKNRKLVKAIELEKWNASRADYTARYGEIPPAPPAPSAPPAPAVPGLAASVPTAPAATVVAGPPPTPIPAQPAGPAPVAESAQPAAPAIHPPVPPAAPPTFINVRRMAIGTSSAQVVTIDGKRESYDLKNPVEKAAFDKKYPGFRQWDKQVEFENGGVSIASDTLLFQPNLQDAEAVVNQPALQNEPPPVVFVDGKEKPYEELKKMPPANIESMEVWKGKSATDKFGDKGKNGVISVKTKNK